MPSRSAELRSELRAVAGRNRIQLGTASLALGGAAFALIQILQGSIGQFNPRPVVSVLLAVCIAMAGWTLGRARQRVVRSRRFSALLREWPLRPLAECDDLELGVFPARSTTADAAGAASEPVPSYVPRELDGPLRDALAGGGMVLVVGPERSGKSRTVLEAARSVAGTRAVVLPVDGEAVSELADDAVAGFAAGAVWWLDDLERYLDDLHGVELSMLLDHGLTVVATLREQRWTELLRAGGEDGERGRRLRGSARVFELPGQLDAREAAAASAAFGDLDLSRGLGEALSAAATGAINRRRSPPRVARGRPDAMVLLGGALTLALGAVLGAVILADGFARPVPPPLAAQVDAIRQRAAAAHELVTFAHSEELHGFDQPSFVFILRPAVQGSDEFRIYDVVDGYLRLRLDFQPHTTVRGAGDSVIHAGDATRAHNGLYDYGLENVRIVDLFGNGESELVADYLPYNSPLSYQLPLIVFWDDVAQRYKVQPLLNGRPSAIPGWAIDPAVRGAYRLSDRTTSTTLHAWATDGYWLEPASSSPAGITVVDTASGPHGSYDDELVDGYDIAPSASGVTSTERECDEAIDAVSTLTTAEMARIASGPYGPATPRLEPVRNTVEACTA